MEQNKSEIKKDSNRKKNLRQTRKQGPPYRLRYPEGKRDGVSIVPNMRQSQDKMRFSAHFFATKIDRLQEQMSAVKRDLQQLEKKINSKEERICKQELIIAKYTDLIENQKDSFYALLLTYSKLFNSEILKDEIIERYFPIYIYLSKNFDDTEEKVFALVSEINFAMKADHVWDSPIQISSFIKNFISKTKDAIKSEEFAMRVDKIENAAEKQFLGIPQAKIDSETAIAVKNLMESIENQPSAIIRIGSLFIMKSEGKVIINNLNQKQIAMYESNPQLWTNPKGLIDKLSAHIDDAPKISNIG